MTHRRSSSHKGFTIIELMLALGVIAVLAVIAVPIYTSQVQAARRADATSAILTMAQQLERCFTRFSSYNNADCPIGDGTVQLSEGNWYEITVAATATTFTLTAEPQGLQVRDTLCAGFGYTHTGRRSVTGTGGVDRCW